MSESVLLEAVRDQLRERCGYQEHQCDVELDEVTPAAVGDFYVAVMPGGFQPGERHNTGGGCIRDYVYSVAVSVMVRANRLPRDRKRKLFLDNLDGIEMHERKIREALDWSEEVRARANKLLKCEVDGFIQPLRLASLEPRPRPVGSDVFGARGNDVQAGLARTTTFGGARLIQTVER